MSESFVEESRKNWESPGVVTDDDLKVGCLQRIAAATELMARNHADLLEHRDRLKRRCERNDESIRYLQRSNAALRGVITRMKSR